MSTVDAADRNAITDLIIDYAYGWDRQEWDRFRSVWAEDAVMTGINGTHYSAAEIEAYARSFHANPNRVGLQSRHCITNMRLEPVDDDHVSSRVYFQMAIQRADEKNAKLLYIGEYHDEFVRTADGWRFASRTVLIDPHA